MTQGSGQVEDALRETEQQIERLGRQVEELFKETQYQDLEHAGLGLAIARHAVHEVIEHTGQGGHIEHTSDPAAHAQAEGWIRTVQSLRAEASTFLQNHPNEDLETALKALAVAEGSLDEVAERYE
jgi:hypothetical protein